MRMFLVAVIAMAVTAIGASFVLASVQQPVAVAFAVGGARPDLAE
jgi:hypothetical protein